MTGVERAESLFETLRVYRGHAFLWERHVVRLAAAAAVLGFPAPRASHRLRESLSGALAARGLADAVVRVSIARGDAGDAGDVAGRPGAARIEVEDVAARLWPGTIGGGATAVIATPRFEPGPLDCHKRTPRPAHDRAREEARAAGADEALLVSPEGFLLEGAVSSLFAVVGGEVLTPPLWLGILPGITRAFVLESCGALGIRAREAPLTLADLAEADEAFVTNSVQEVVPLATLAGRPLPARAIGLRLRAAYREAVARAAG
jgi:branched-subunit amino acid aminotransferase/4-amino-4-deoxychorismate lyase